MNHTITFRASGRGKAQCAPNPDYPDGKAIDLCGEEVLNCLVDLPYPASECGMWIVRCQVCPLAIGITAAGRPDDPICVRVPCDLGKVGKG